MRKSIDRFATLIQDYPYGNSIFLFSGWSNKHNKWLYLFGDGFTITMLYKRIDNGKLQWSKNKNELRKLSQQVLRWLLEGLSLKQPKAIVDKFLLYLPLHRQKKVLERSGFITNDKNYLMG